MLLQCKYLQIGLKPKQIFDQQCIYDFYKRRVISTTDFYEGTPCSYCVCNIDPHIKYSFSRNNLKYKMPRHKFSYILYYNKLILPGYEIHHKCCHKGCDNVLHLEALTSHDHGILTNKKRLKNHIYQTKDEKVEYQLIYSLSLKAKTMRKIRYKTPHAQSVRKAWEKSSNGKASLKRTSKKQCQKIKAEKELLVKE